MGRPAHAEQAGQLPLQSTWTQRAAPARDPHRTARHQRPRKPICAACQAREARYGFQDEENPTLDRPRTLCFECFRMEIDRRHDEAARRARSCRVEQARLPLDDKLDELRLRRRRAQIAARHAVGQ